MIQEMQKDQKPEEAQISFKVFLDHAKDGQNDTLVLQPGCTTVGPHLQGRTDKAQVQKDKNVSPRDEQSWTAADETVPEEMEARKRAVRLHQTCEPVDQCAHRKSESEECPLTTRHEAWSKEDSCKKRRVMPTPHSKQRRDLTDFTTVGTPTCRRETRVISTREGK